MTMNPFEAHAEASTPRPVKVRQQAAKKAAVTRESKREEEEERILLSLFLAGQREERDALLNGPHGGSVKALLAFARNMTLQSAPELVERVRAATWLQGLSVDDKFIVLRLLNNGIVNLRKRSGLPEFHDALPDREPKAFHKIKTILGLDGK